MQIHSFRSRYEQIKCLRKKLNQVNNNMCVVLNGGGSMIHITSMSCTFVSGMLVSCFKGLRLQNSVQVLSLSDPLDSSQSAAKSALKVLEKKKTKFFLVIPE